MSERPYRDAFTITRLPDGSWQAKQHGYPFWTIGKTAEECLQNAGRIVDHCAKSRDEFTAMLAAQKGGCGVSKIANRYVSPGGRLPGYGRKEFTDDLICAANFLAWAQEDNAFYGGETAADAFKAVCRLLDMNSVRLRNIVLGRAAQKEG